MEWPLPTKVYFFKVKFSNEFRALGGLIIDVEACLVFASVKGKFLWKKLGTMQYCLIADSMYLYILFI